MNIYIICPVGNATPEQKLELETYTAELEKKGHGVHYPARDTVQDKDEIGYDICADNCDAIYFADEIHLYWDKHNNSRGSIFDLGMAFAIGKPLVLINPMDVPSREGKCMENIVCYWSFKSDETADPSDAD